MIYYCDTEFTSFEGDLMSIALVPENESRPWLYMELQFDEKKLHPWVVNHVIPHMIGPGARISKEHAANEIRRYLKDDPEVTVIADWPEDLSHFLNLLIVGPGQMVSLDNITTKLKRTRGWNSADHSAIPHHALYDAIAIRDYWNELLAV